MKIEYELFEVYNPSEYDDFNKYGYMRKTTYDDGKVLHRQVKESEYLEWYNQTPEGRAEIIKNRFEQDGN